MWLNSGGIVANEWVVFDLGDSYDLTTVKIWNYNEAPGGYINRGIATMDIIVSANPSMTPATNLGQFSLAQAPGDSTTPFGQTLTLNDANNVRYVKFEVTTTHGDMIYVGLSKVRFSTTGEIGGGIGGLTTEDITPPGQYYDANVPNTLDLAERAKLLVQGLL